MLSVPYYLLVIRILSSKKLINIYVVSDNKCLVNLWPVNIIFLITNVIFFLTQKLKNENANYKTQI